MKLLKPTLLDAFTWNSKEELQMKQERATESALIRYMQVRIDYVKGERLAKVYGLGEPRKKITFATVI